MIFYFTSLFIFTGLYLFFFHTFKSYFSAIKDNKKVKRGNIYEFSLIAFPLSLFILTIKICFIDYIHIPSKSMLPNFPVESTYFINKNYFGIKNPYTLDNITLNNKPYRGQVVVSSFPLNKDILYIKRVIALPGDTLSLTDKGYKINGVFYPFKFIKKLEIKDNADMTVYDQYSLNINNVKFNVVIDPLKTFNSQPEIILDGYFLVGDNLTGSFDSRDFGPVDFKYFLASLI